jgi:2,3-diaminopropionate biosynthesis protein SbnB
MNTYPSFLIIRNEIVKEIINNNIEEIYHLIKQTYLLHSSNKTVNPPSYFLKFPDMPEARIIALPAAIQNESKRIAGIKWVASNPNNYINNLPRASAVVLLNDYATGFPIACIEGSKINAIRTSLSAVLFTEYAKSFVKHVTTLGIIGSGLIAEHVIYALEVMGWTVDNILIYDINEENSNKFKSRVPFTKFINIQSISSLEKTICSSDLLLFTTTSSSPYINNPQLFKHNPIVLHLSLRDLAPEIIIKAANIVDDIEHINHAETSIHISNQSYPHLYWSINTIGDILEGKYILPQGKPIIFSPMGLGVLDINLAYYIYQKAKEKKKGVNIENFFCD